MPGLAFALRAAVHPLATTFEWAVVAALLVGSLAVLALAIRTEYRRARADARAPIGWEPADPKETGNDGDPIRAAHELWLGCPRCGCRHPARERCPEPEEAARRLAEDARAGEEMRRLDSMLADQRRWS